MIPTDMAKRPADKGFAISAEGFQRDQLFFRRHHTGEPPVPSARLTPLWPLLAVSTVVMLTGLYLVVRAPSAGVAFGGLILSGLALVGMLVFVWLLGSERHG